MSRAKGSRHRRALARVARQAVALCLIAPLALWPIAGAEAAPPQEKRKDLMDQLGLSKKKKQPPKPDQPDQPDQPAQPDQPSDAPQGEAPDPKPPKTTAKPKVVTYEGRIRKLLTTHCKSCHASGGAAGGTRFSISGDANTDYKLAKQLVRTTKPKSSVLLMEAAGTGHGGGTIFPAGSSNYASLLAWIEAGAPRGGKPAAPSPTPAPTPDASPSEAKPKPKPEAPGKSGKSQTSKPLESDTPEPSEPSELEPTWVEPTRIGIPYAPRVHEILSEACGNCHAEDATADWTKLALSGDVATDYPRVRALVDLADPPASVLLSKGRGEGHAGGVSIDPSSDDYAKVLSWIRAGALGPTANDLPLANEPQSAPESAPEQPQVDATTSASPHAAEPGARLGDGTPVPDATPSRLPFSLPYHLRLNGRFDLAYERRDYKNQPFGPGRNALATYHHFLFLSRSGAADPFGFNIELITQQFYEFNARFTSKNKRAKVLIKAGKILVPFGNEPLFHTSYGGRAGFDQQLMPVVWSQPGLAVNAHIVAGPLTITSDTFAIQGYALRSDDGVLNLQNDFSSSDNFQFGVGERVGLSWRPLTAWYSIQVNPLGFDRRLVMQAIDVEFWRIPKVPFLRDLVVGAGIMRADISGGGPGLDYYHFGSYGMLRYYPIDWLYVQYRWGLRTFDNRRGVYYDDTRADERDGSSHNLTIGATYMGFFTALQLFWNLEKANEQDDDFLRLTVGYAF